MTLDTVDRSHWFISGRRYTYSFISGKSFYCSVSLITPFASVNIESVTVAIETLQSYFVSAQKCSDCLKWLSVSIKIFEPFICENREM
jgi:hypothetical protein